MRRLASALCAAAMLLGAARASADDVPDTPAWNANVGQVTGIGIALLVGDGGSVGGGLELSTRYGLVVGPIVLAPGGRAGGYYLDERLIGVFMATGRVTVPVGPVAPFLQAGAGAGVLGNPGDGGIAWLVGGGLMIHFGRQLAIGVEVSRQGISGTGFDVLAIGPSIVIGG